MPVIKQNQPGCCCDCQFLIDDFIVSGGLGDYVPRASIGGNWQIESGSWEIIEHAWDQSPVNLWTPNVDFIEDVALITTDVGARILWTPPNPESLQDSYLRVFLKTRDGNPWDTAQGRVVIWWEDWNNYYYVQVGAGQALRIYQVSGGVHTDVTSQSSVPEVPGDAEWAMVDVCWSEDQIRARLYYPYSWGYVSIARYEEYDSTAARSVATGLSKPSGNLLAGIEVTKVPTGSEFALFRWEDVCFTCPPYCIHCQNGAGPNEWLVELENFSGACASFNGSYVLGRSAQCEWLLGDYSSVELTATKKIRVAIGKDIGGCVNIATFEVAFPADPIDCLGVLRLEVPNIGLVGQACIACQPLVPAGDCFISAN